MFNLDYDLTRNNIVMVFNKKFSVILRENYIAVLYIFEIP